MEKFRPASSGAPENGVHNLLMSDQPPQLFSRACVRGANLFREAVCGNALSHHFRGLSQHPNSSLFWVLSKKDIWSSCACLRKRCISFRKKKKKRDFEAGGSEEPHRKSYHELRISPPGISSSHCLKSGLKARCFYAFVHRLVRLFRYLGTV